MLAESKKMVLVRASKEEIFDLFNGIPQSWKNSFKEHFKAWLCSEPFTGEILFSEDEWYKITSNAAPTSFVVDNSQDED